VSACDVVAKIFWVVCVNLAEVAPKGSADPVVDVLNGCAAPVEGVPKGCIVGFDCINPVEDVPNGCVDPAEAAPNDCGLKKLLAI